MSDLSNEIYLFYSSPQDAKSTISPVFSYERIQAANEYNSYLPTIPEKIEFSPVNSAGFWVAWTEDQGENLPTSNTALSRVYVKRISLLR
jgi:hypothetical protein